MKAFKIIAVLVLMLLLQTGGGVKAESSNMRTIEVLNLTGFHLKEMYMTVNADGGRHWGKNLISSGLDDADITKINVFSDVDYHDLKIVWDNGASREWTGKSNNRINITKSTWRLTIYRDSSSEVSGGSMVFRVKSN